jgi:lipopolysaccharide exporter
MTVPTDASTRAAAAVHLTAGAAPDETPGGSAHAGLGRRVLTGAAWSAAGGAVLRVSNLLVGVVAARLLDPKDFGVFAVSLVIYTFIGQVAELGLHSALLRASDDEFDTVAPTALTLALISYSVLGVGLVLLAPLIASAFGTPDAVPAMRLLSVCVFLGAPASIPNAQLRREFRMAVQTGTELIGFAVSSVVLVALALAGHGAMSLAWSRVVAQVVVVVCLQLVVAKRYLPGYRRSQARGILALGLPLVGATLLGTVIAGVNVFFIGRMSGAEGVGLFNLGDTMSAWPIGLFLPVLLNVGLPLFARIRHDPTVVQDVLTRCVELIVAIFWPVSVMLAALAPYLVDVLYGSKWMPAAALIQVLAFCKVGEIVFRLCTDVTVAGGHTRRYLRVQSAWLVVQVPTVWWAAGRWGVTGVVWMNLVLMFAVVVPMYLALVRPMISGKIHQVFLTSAVPAGAAIVAALCARLASSVPTQPWAALVVGSVVGAVVYVALAAHWARGAVARARRLRDTAGWEAAA